MGVSGRQDARDRVEEFNSVVRGGGETVPGRLLDRQPLDEPPFYVIEAARDHVRLGGLLIDAEAHALSANGRRTVPGLLVAGADAGGLYRRAYAGGLAPALVFRPRGRSDRARPRR